MTSTLTRTSQAQQQAVAEWCKVFPRQAVETYTASATFMKQLTVVAVSTITYLKNAFHEDNYTVDAFGGLKIRLLKDKCDDEMAQFLVSALTQAFDAFDKKYLHQIALCFYEERCSPETLLEYHLFEYGYEGGAPSVSVRSGARGALETTVTLDALRERTVQLLRACMVMLSNHELPETYDVSIRLYYNDAAPAGYQAPGFSAAADSWADEYIARSGAGRVKLGSVHTRHHRLHLHTHQRHMHAPTGSESASVISQDRPSSQPESLEPTAGDAAPGETRAGAGAGVRGAEGAVRCDCGRDDRDAHMLLCSVCGCYQHATCYGVRGGGAGGWAGGGAVGGHCCLPCGERTGRSVDPALQRASNRTCLAIFRRALVWLAEGSARVSVSAVSGAMCLNEGSARKLMRVLKAHGVIATEAPADADAAVELVPAELEAIIAKYFPSPSRSPLPAPGTPAPGPAPEDPDDLPLRLLQQSQASRGSDPLAEVLSPLERVSLQATNNTALVTDPVATLDKQDSTLEQYRRALAPLDASNSPAAVAAKPHSPPRKRKAAADTTDTSDTQTPRAAGVRTKRKKKQDK